MKKLINLKQSLQIMASLHVAHRNIKIEPPGDYGLLSEVLIKTEEIQDVLTAKNISVDNVYTKCELVGQTNIMPVKSEINTEFQSCSWMDVPSFKQGPVNSDQVFDVDEHVLPESDDILLKLHVPLIEKTIKSTNEDLPAFNNVSFRIPCEPLRSDGRKIMPDSETLRSYYCKVCYKVYSTSAMLKTHIEATHLSIRYKCERCNFSSCYKHYLKHHKKIAHEGFRYFCSKCPFTSRHKPSLKYHSLKQHGLTEFNYNFHQYNAADINQIRVNTDSIEKLPENQYNLPNHHPPVATFIPSQNQFSQSAEHSYILPENMLSQQYNNKHVFRESNDNLLSKSFYPPTSQETLEFPYDPDIYMKPQNSFMCFPKCTSKFVYQNDAFNTFPFQSVRNHHNQHPSVSGSPFMNHTYTPHSPLYLPSQYISFKPSRDFQINEHLNSQVLGNTAMYYLSPRSNCYEFCETYSSSQVPCYFTKTPELITSPSHSHSSYLEGPYNSTLNYSGSQIPDPFMLPPNNHQHNDPLPHKYCKFAINKQNESLKSGRFEQNTILPYGSLKMVHQEQCNQSNVFRTFCQTQNCCYNQLSPTTCDCGTMIEKPVCQQLKHVQHIFQNQMPRIVKPLKSNCKNEIPELFNVSVGNCDKLVATSSSQPIEQIFSSNYNSFYPVDTGRLYELQQIKQLLRPCHHNLKDYNNNLPENNGVSTNKCAYSLKPLSPFPISQFETVSHLTAEYEKNQLNYVSSSKPVSYHCTSLASSEIEKGDLSKTLPPVAEYYPEVPVSPFCSPLVLYDKPKEALNLIPECQKIQSTKSENIMCKQIVDITQKEAWTEQTDHLFYQKNNDFPEQVTTFNRMPQEAEVSEPLSKIQATQPPELPPLAKDKPSNSQLNSQKNHPSESVNRVILFNGKTFIVFLPPGNRCKKCTFVATSKKELLFHQRVVHNHPSLHSCHLCPYETKLGYRLKRHIASKHDLVRYKCFSCSSDFASSNYLKYHIRLMHENDRPVFKCDSCCSIFSRKTDLSRHILVKHNGFRFSCPICTQKFTSPSSLTRHIYSKHKNIRYYCHHCSSSYCSKAKVVIHIKKVHLKKKK